MKRSKTKYILFLILLLNFTKNISAFEIAIVNEQVVMTYFRGFAIGFAVSTFIISKDPLIKTTSLFIASYLIAKNRRNI